MTHPATRPLQGPARRPPGPLTIWPGLPAPADQNGPLTAAIAARITAALTRPGDLVAVPAAEKAAAAAAAAAGRRVVTLPRGGRHAVAACGAAALAITGWPAAGERTPLLAGCWRALRPGGILAVCVPAPAPGGTVTDHCGDAVAAARAARFGYAQHIVVVHAAIRGDRLDPGLPLAPARAGGHRVHSDLLVFLKPHGAAR